MITEINSGNLAADADVGRAGHKIVTRSLSECLISSTDSETCGVIYDAAASAGFALLTASSAGNVRTEHRLIEDLAGRNVDGILVATMMTKADIPGLRHPGLPIVLINCPFAVPGVSHAGAGCCGRCASGGRSSAQRSRAPVGCLHHRRNECARAGGSRGWMA